MDAVNSCDASSSLHTTAAAYEWLLFDADGTLFDYDRAESAALRQVFERIGEVFEAGHLAHYRAINQALWQDLERKLITPAALKVRRFERLLQRIGITHSPEHFSEMYLQSLGSCCDLIEGAQEVLQMLHGNYRLAIVTNGLQAVQRNRLFCSPLRDYITDLIISEEIGAAKPDAEFFDVTFARLGHPARERVLMVGDNWIADIQGAAQYGLDTCWYNPARRPRPPEPSITLEITSLRELIPWLGVAKNRPSC